MQFPHDIDQALESDGLRDKQRAAIFLGLRDDARVGFGRQQDDRQMARAFLRADPPQDMESRFLPKSEIEHHNIGLRPGHVVRSRRRLAERAYRLLSSRGDTQRPRHGCAVQRRREKLGVTGVVFD